MSIQRVYPLSYISMINTYRLRASHAWSEIAVDFTQHAKATAI